MRCEGYRRYGGAFTLGPITWVQCTNNAIVELTAVQDNKESTFPACLHCWKEAIEKKINVTSVVPLSEEKNVLSTHRLLLWAHHRIKQEREKQGNPCVRSSDWTLSEGRIAALAQLIRIVETNGAEPPEFMEVINGSD